MPASPGRPGLSALTPKGERTRQRVIAAAAQLVLDRGVGVTTIVFTRWETAIRGGLRAMHARGALRAGANPDDLATATLAPFRAPAAGKIQRTIRPLEAALDAMLAHIAACATPPQPRRGPAGQGSLPAP